MIKDGEDVKVFALKTYHLRQKLCLIHTQGKAAAAAFLDLDNFNPDAISQLTSQNIFSQIFHLDLFAGLLPPLLPIVLQLVRVTTSGHYLSMVKSLW